MEGFLGGDDEIASLLEGMQPLKKRPKVEKKTVTMTKKERREESETSFGVTGAAPKGDDRLSQMRWPEWWSLGAAIAHDCIGYTPLGEATAPRPIYASRCARCNRASATHLLCPGPKSRLGDDGDVASSLRRLFTITRNIRCASGEYGESSGGGSKKTISF